MDPAVKALTGWRNRRDTQREVVREVREAVPDALKAVMMEMAARIDRQAAELAGMKEVMAALAREAMKNG